jgi:DNA adenine methylase
MILRRLGNKQAIAQDIIKYFPDHKIYFEPFFGAGGMFFNKPKAKYNVVNDLDSEVFNLFQVVINQKEELEKAFYLMPIHSDLFEYYKSNEQTDPIQKALRFLFFSNLTTIGVVSSGMSLSFTKNKNIFFKVIDKTYEMIVNSLIMILENILKHLHLTRTDGMTRQNLFSIATHPI